MSLLEASSINFVTVLSPEAILRYLRCGATDPCQLSRQFSPELSSSLGRPSVPLYRSKNVEDSRVNIIFSMYTVAYMVTSRFEFAPTVVSYPTR